MELLRRVFFAALPAAATVGIVAAGAQAPPPSIHRATLDKYCVTCHNARLRTASMLLDQADVDHPETNAAVWEKVLHKLRAREMPPVGVPHPDDATYNGLARYLGCGRLVSSWAAMVYVVFPWHLARTPHPSLVHLELLALPEHVGFELGPAQLTASLCQGRVAGGSVAGKGGGSG